MASSNSKLSKFFKLFFSFEIRCCTLLSYSANADCKSSELKGCRKQFVEKIIFVAIERQNLFKTVRSVADSDNVFIE